ncbi:MAG: cache domain-containing protein [Pseudomonadota bacterium]
MSPLVFHRTRNLIWWAGILVLSAVSMILAYSKSELQGYENLDDVSLQQLGLYAGELESELSRYDFLPSIVGLDNDILALLGENAQPGLREKVNQRLATLNVKANTLAIYVMDASGMVVAASNGYLAESLVGADYSSRPYFLEAIRGESARYFAADPTRGAPEFYFAQSILHKGRVLGVAAAKISLEPMESSWIASIPRSGYMKLLVVDENDVIVMSSVKEWKYRTMHSLSAAEYVKLMGTAKYPQVLTSLGAIVGQALKHGTHLVTLNEKKYIAQERFLLRSDWRLIVFSDVAEVRRSARQAALGAGVLIGFIGLLGMYLRQRYRGVAQQLAAREALQRAHDQLEMKVEERTAELLRANMELVQAGKLALLGQMSASITHEINQPLTALRSSFYNTQLLLKRGNLEGVEKNLKSMSDLIGRMGKITGQLKSFARKTPSANRPVQLEKAVTNALLVLENRIQTENVELQIDVSPTLFALCDDSRLEQVLLNLCSNALDAMKDAVRKTMSIEAKIVEGRVKLIVSDTGPGLSMESMSHLFEPFFSTKAPGEGLGLGLVISANIVREFGGSLRGRSDDVGAVFEFDLEFMEENHV